jgi:arylsulfatase A-like enzyme
MMTGRYPLSDQVFFFDEFLPHPTWALPHLLKKAGYTTAFFSNHVGLSRFNESLGKAFDAFIVKGDGVAADGPTKGAMAWIKANARKKFFLWLFYFDTHEDFVGFPKSREGILPEDARKYVRAYDDHIRYVDAQIALLIQHLKNLGMQQRTMIIVTSDHGELLGEHADQYTYFKHGDRPWEFLIRVPLVLYCPKVLPKGRIVQQQVQHIDLPSTICDVLGIRIHRAFEGKSLLATMKKGGADPGYAFIESRSVPGGFLTASETPEYQYAVRTTDWKLMFNRFTDGTAYYKFYHLSSDPLEASDLLMAEQGRVAVFKAALDDFLLRQAKYTAGPVRKALTQEQANALKSLGYAQ